jgi:hypothetical protein
VRLGRLSQETSPLSTPQLSKKGQLERLLSAQRLLADGEVELRNIVVKETV